MPAFERVRLSSLALLVVAAYAVAAVASAAEAGATCPATVTPSARVDCGYPNITEAQCSERGCCWGTGQPAAVPECYYPGAGVPIKVVHVIQACHLDVGFKEMANDIVNLYFDTHFPHAIQWAQELRAAGGAPQLKFMTQSYLVSLFMDCPSGMGLHCPNASYVADFTAAVKRGDIYWHAFPFNAELEAMSADEVAFGVRLTHDLDKRFGQSEKVTLSQRDVPGMTRSVLPVLSAAGVQAISVGVNGASMPPNVPRVFMWRDPVSNVTVPSMWHPHGYGGITLADAVIVPGSSHAMVFEWNGDNDGPPPISDIKSTWETVAKEFPGAEVVASTFDNFTQHLVQHTSGLPVLTREIGDTWMYGVPSDPWKVVQMRAMSRARTECLASGACSVSDAAFYNMSRLYIKSAEHTWGEDVKTWLHDTTNWTNADFAAVRDTAPNFLTIQQSWVEQRNWGVDFPVQALGDAPLAAEMKAAFADAVASTPDPAALGFKQAATGQVFQTDLWEAAFDGTTGAVNRLLHRATGRVIANATKLLGLLQYRTYDLDAYKTFWNEYFSVHPPPSYGPLDFGKPGFQVAAPLNKVWAPTLKAVWYKQAAADASVTLLARLAFDDEAVRDYGAPAEAWLNVTLPGAPAAGGSDDGDDTVGFTVLVVNKTATRLPETMYVQFDAAVPAVSEADASSGAVKGWAMDKLGEYVAPTDVQDGGAQHMHGVASGVRYSYDFAAGTPGAATPGGAVFVDTLDAPVVAWTDTSSGFPTPCNQPPTVAHGASFCLYENEWGTNYVMWWPFLGGAQQSIKYRFAVRVR